MRLFLSSLIFVASISASAATAIDCRVHFVDDAVYATVDRENGNLSLTVKIINLNTDLVEKSVTEPATEMTEQLERSISSRTYSLDLLRVGRIFTDKNGTRILASKGTLTSLFPNGKTQTVKMDCETTLNR
jgi:hypothetical protein